MADMYRVTTLLGGPYVTGGGIQQFYFDLAGGTMQQATNAVKAFWTSVAAHCGTGTTFATQNLCEQVDAENGNIVAAAAVTGGTATANGGTEVLALASQGLVQWRTGVYSDGREIRGRTFLPAMIETSNTGGVPSGTFAGVIPTYAAALIADTSSTLLVWRRPREAYAGLGNEGQAGYRPPHDQRDGEFAPVLTGTLSAKWAVLRSRRD